MQVQMQYTAVKHWQSNLFNMSSEMFPQKFLHIHYRLVEIYLASPNQSNFQQTTETCTHTQWLYPHQTSSF